jgi:hypothetical protein
MIHWVSVFLVGMLSASSVHSPKRLKVMLIDLPGDTAYKASEIRIVNAFLAKDLRDRGFDVVTAADIAAVLGVERQKQILGCGNDSCLAELGGVIS